MKKGYYIYYGSNSSGVVKKINMQLKELGKYYEMELLLVESKELSSGRKLLSFFPTADIGFKYDDVLKHLENPYFIYFRQMTVDASLIRLFESIKTKYPLCIILFEIPTYPYFRDNYAQNFKHLLRSTPFIIKDFIYRRKLKKYVDRIITFSEDDELLGIKTIKTANGFDVSSVTVSKSEYKKEQLTIISVAMYANHHGYERIIKSLASYYDNGGSRNIVYYCIGFGAELLKYKKLVSEYNLGNHVFFPGKMTGETLNDYYSKAHIGLDFFGGYKEGLYYISSLKTVEYVSRGLPVATGIRVNAFENHPCNYYIQFSNDNSLIDVNKLLDFYDIIYAKPNLHESIRNYAFSAVDYSVTMSDIISFIN